MRVDRQISELKDDTVSAATKDSFDAEIKQGNRFEFGKNWRNFLLHLNGKQIEDAERSLRELLRLGDLTGCRFLDIGSGSGLFSLAARRLGARVTSFDYDPESVACTRELKERFYSNDPDWVIEQGSVLDAAFMAPFQHYDVVYSWGVLHHTGNMWDAVGCAAACVRPGGRLALALYNDQGTWSRRWLKLKRLYNALPRVLKLPYACLVMGARELPLLFWLTIKGRPLSFFRHFFEYGGERGMSYWTDMVDWIGGYPFEVARPELVFRFLVDRGFEMIDFSSQGSGLGCNEYLFQRKDRVGVVNLDEGATRAHA